MAVRNTTRLMAYLRQRLGAPMGSRPEFQFYCPFCIDRLGNESANRKLNVNVDRDLVHCYRCGYGARSFLKLFRDLNGGKLTLEEQSLVRREPEAESVRDFHSALLVSLCATTGAKGLAELEPVDLPSETLPVTLQDRRTRRAVRYMTEHRKPPMTPEQVVDAVSHFNIGYCPSGRYGQRLVFPVYMRGRQVYFTTRYAGNHARKSLNAKKSIDAQGALTHYSRDTVLLNFDNAAGHPKVFIVEGPFDLIGCHMAGLVGVGLMGKVMSDQQLSLLCALQETGTQEFVVLLDSDAGEAGYAIYQKAQSRLASVSMVQLDAGDPYERWRDLPRIVGETRSGPSLGGRLTAIMATAQNNAQRARRALDKTRTSRYIRSKSSAAR